MTSPRSGDSAGRHHGEPGQLPVASNSLIVTSSCYREPFQTIRNDYGLVDRDHYSQVTAGRTGVLNELPLPPLSIQKSETDPGYFSLIV